MLVIGIAASVLTGILGFWEGAAIVGWSAAALVYTAWVWFIIHNLDATQTAQHATREDPTRPVAELLILLASLASLGAVAVVLVNSSGESSSSRFVLGALALASIILSWLLVHTIYTLRYASLYYRGPEGGIDFNQTQPPCYRDFAYVAFTLGMTYQVSDTSFQSSEMRSTALLHSLLSYVFGAVILATTINLLAGLFN